MNFPCLLCEPGGEAKGMFWRKEAKHWRFEFLIKEGKCSKQESVREYFLSKNKEVKKLQR